MRYFEDFREGDVREFGSFDVTREEIIAFAREFDPQPFHIDEEAAKASLLGGLATSGWQTAAISMRLLCQHLFKDIAALGSPGINDMRWLKPVREGYRVKLRTLVKSARLSRSKPGMGILEIETRMFNQADKELMIQHGITLVASRDAPASMLSYEDVVIAPADAWQKPDQILDKVSNASDDDALLTCWFDDAKIGQTLALGSFDFDAENIKRYAEKWDPQPFHTSEEAARKGPFGKLAASGWHTGAAGMRRHVLSRNLYITEGQRRGLAQAPRGPSPGFRDMRWHEPVFAGDRVNYYMTTIEKRKLSRPGWGIVFNHFEGVNQHGRRVYDYVSAGMWAVKQDG